MLLKFSALSAATLMPRLRADTPAPFHLHALFTAAKRNAEERKKKGAADACSARNHNRKRVYFLLDGVAPCRGSIRYLGAIKVIAWRYVTRAVRSSDSARVNWASYKYSRGTPRLGIFARALFRRLVELAEVCARRGSSLPLQRD